MSLLNLFTRLEKLEINLELEGNKLQIDAPKGALTEGLVNELKEQRERIIEFLREKVGTQIKFISIEPVKKMDVYVLSSAQRRMYFLQQYDPGSTVFNIIQEIELTEPIDVKKIETTFKKLIQRHESLRTSFRMDKDVPVQKIHNDIEFEIRHFDRKLFLEKADDNDLKDFFCSFDLSQPPLFRLGLIDIKNKRYKLVLVIHHIIADAISYQILIKDFITLYNGEELMPLRLQYKDYAEWQNNQMRKGLLKQQEEYWLKDFEEYVPILNLPLDYERPGTRSFDGSVIGFRVTEEETMALKQIAVEKGITLFAVLLAIYDIFLSKICKQEIIVVGTPIAGRRHADLEQVVGMFVNVLTIKNKVDHTKPFADFLSEVKEKSLKDFENQDYPFEELVAKLGTERIKGRNHLVETHFVFHNATSGKSGSNNSQKKYDLQVIPYEFHNNTAHLDISLIVTEMDTNIECAIQYCTQLFKKKTIEKFCGYISNIVTAIIKNPGVLIGELDLLSDEEKDRIISSDQMDNDLVHQLKGVDFDEIF